jgi:hypothetical protein
MKTQAALPVVWCSVYAWCIWASMILPSRWLRPIPKA